MRTKWIVLAGIAIAATGLFVELPSAAGHFAPSPPGVSFIAAESNPGVAIDLFRASRIYIQGTLNGNGVEMMLDNGAGMTVVDSAYASQIGLVAGSRTIAVRGASGAVEGRLAPGASLAIGRLRLTDMTVLILDLSATSKQIGRPIRVLLGREAFESSVVTIDFEKRMLAFEPPAGFVPPPNAEKLPLRNIGEGPRKLPLSVNGLDPVMAELDIGHGGSLILSRAYWETQEGLATLPYAKTERGGVGGVSPRRIATMKTLALGGQIFRDVPATLNEVSTDLPATGANIGIDILSRFKLAIDYSHDAIYLTPTQATFAKGLPRDRAGMRLELANDRLRVLFVSPQSPAYEGGWRAGDEIIAVNDERVGPDYFSGSQSDWAGRPAGSRIDLVLADGTHRPLTLKDYF